MFAEPVAMPVLKSMRVTEYLARDFILPMNIEHLGLLEHIKTDPLKELFTTEMLGFLDCGHTVQTVQDWSTLAKFYCSGKFSEYAMEEMVNAAIFYTEEASKYQPPSEYVFNKLPETEENYKFMFKVMKMKGHMEWL